MSSKFGQLLLWGNLITPEQLQQALEHQRRHGGKLGEILHELGHISGDDVTRTLGMKYGVPTVNLDHIEIDRETLDLIPAESACTLRVVPLSRVGSMLTCALEDPSRTEVIKEVEFFTGCNIQPVLVTSAMMTAALERSYPSGRSPSAPIAAPHESKAEIILEINRRLERLSPDKLHYVRRFIASIQPLP